MVHFQSGVTPWRGPKTRKNLWLEEGKYSEFRNFNTAVAAVYAIWWGWGSGIVFLAQGKFWLKKAGG